MLSRLARIFAPLLEIGKNLWTRFTTRLPDGLRPHAVPLALGAGVLLLAIFIVIAALAGSGGKPKPLARRAVPATQAAPLRNYHLVFETNLADAGAREHIIRPEELPVRQERNYLEENLGKSRLFDQAELQIQNELNRRARQ